MTWTHWWVVSLIAWPALGVAQAPRGAASLGWMSGCWELRSARRLTQEHWMPPLGGMLLGMSRTAIDSAVREHESLRIVSGPDGLRYVARPADQPETSFLAVTVSDTAVAFENPAHDFPQRIEYVKRGADSLVARISGPRGGERRVITFAMRRASCHP